MGDGQTPPAWQGCVVTRRRELNATTVMLTLRAPAIAAAAQPGQFVHVRVPTVGYDPYLRRPISLATLEPAKDEIGLIIHAVGRGTRRLAEAGRGAELDLLGPLGRGFPPPGKQRVLVVGGGIGAAPLFGLAYKSAGGLDRHTAQTKMLFLVGARNAAELWARELCAELGLPALAATDDGSVGHPGLVTDLLAVELGGGRIATVYACGPGPMLAAVARQAQEAGVDCYVSLEERMGCGVGACLGCAWPRSEKAGGGYLRVCADGPVVNAAEVVL